MKWILRASIILLIIALFFALFSVSVKKGAVEIRLKPWAAKVFSSGAESVKKKARKKIKKIEKKTEKTRKKIEKKVEESKEKIEEITEEEQEKLEKILERH